jgi:hypothetical protein
MPVLLNIFVVLVKIHKCKGHLGEVGVSDYVLVNQPKKATFFLASFNLDKDHATIRVMMEIVLIGGPMNAQ